MPSFGANSKNILKTCHPDLVLVMEQSIKVMDFSVLEGHRSMQRQNQLFKQRSTKVLFPNSKHNAMPSNAVDVAPYPIDWSNEHKNLSRYYYLAGTIMAIAHKLKAQGRITNHLRWGGDWDMDKNFADQNFDDLVHFEILED